MLRNSIVRIFVCSTVFLETGCFAPETISQCNKRSTIDSRRECIEENMARDVVGGATTGAVVGTIIGASIGAAINGWKGAWQIGIVGAISGGASGGLVAYYVTHREADAFLDILASNLKFQDLTETYKEKSDALEKELIIAKQKIALSSYEIDRMREDNKKEIERLKKYIEEIEIGLKEYIDAIIYARNTSPSVLKGNEENINFEIKKRDNLINELNIKLEGAYERIRQIDMIRFSAHGKGGIS